MLRLPGVLLSLVILVTIGGCHGHVIAQPSEPVVVRTPGPPPHAPAHGHRRKHGRRPELRYDGRLDVYVVVGETDVYYRNGRFIRVRGGGWEISADLGGPWEVATADRIPPGLRGKHHARKPKKPKKRGRGAAKIAW